jgi:hypothetical protein
LNQVLPNDVGCHIGHLVAIDPWDEQTEILKVCNYAGGDCSTLDNAVKQLFAVHFADRVTPWAISRQAQARFIWFMKMIEEISRSFPCSLSHHRNESLKEIVKSS